MRLDSKPRAVPTLTIAARILPLAPGATPGTNERRLLRTTRISIECPLMGQLGDGRHLWESRPTSLRLRSLARTDMAARCHVRNTREHELGRPLSTVARPCTRGLSMCPMLIPNGGPSKSSAVPLSRAWPMMESLPALLQQALSQK